MHHRTQAKLDSVAKEIENESGVEDKTVTVDFVNDESRQYKLKIASHIEGKYFKLELCKTVCFNSISK